MKNLVYNFQVRSIKIETSKMLWVFIILLNIFKILNSNAHKNRSDYGISKYTFFQFFEFFRLS
jgi:hypothetical protein